MIPPGEHAPILYGGRMSTQLEQEQFDVMRVKAMPSCPMTPEEIKNQCDFVSECLDAGVDEIREDDEWMFGS